MARPRRAQGWRVLGIMAVVALVLVLFPPAASALSHELTNHREVPNNACGLDTDVAGFADREEAAEVHQRSIDCVADHGIALGSEGRYHPAEPVNRGQMASFVARTLEAAGDRALPEDPGGHFGDTAGSVHEHRIDQLAEIGVVQGRTAERYDPHGTVSRAQMASFVLRAASWNHDHADAPAGDDPYFLDIEGNVHADAIRAAYELWLLEGREAGEYHPDDPVSRDAMATFLTRLLDLVHPNAYLTNNQTYVMSPMEPVDSPADQPVEVSVDASRAEYTDGPEPMPGPVRQALHLALFPCDTVTWEELPATFAGDQVAAAIGTSDNRAAYISEVNGEPVQGRAGMVANVAPQDGRITFTVASFGAQVDCAVVVAFDDRAPADELRLDAGGRPANPYGFAVVRWADGDAVVPGQWESLPDAPIGPRLNHTATWAGDRLVVWGGGDGEGVENTGAAWDPEAEEWSEVPAAPIEARWAHHAVWTGDELIVWGGSEGPDHLATCYADGARYDPAAGAWQEMAEAPGEGRCGAAVAWTGDELLVVGGHPGGGPPGPGDLHDDGVAYDPQADEWREIPAAPLAARSGTASGWTGDELIVVGGTGAEGEAFGDGAAYDPVADEWRTIAQPTIPARGGLSGAWIGDELLVFGGQDTTAGGEDRTDAAAYDPVVDTWRPIDDLPAVQSSPEVAWTGSLLYVVGGDATVGPDDDVAETPAFLAYDAGDDAWITLPDPPDVPRTNHAVAWDGTRLHLWGGQAPDEPAPAGAVWHEADGG
jgi:hypothetical protein